MPGSPRKADGASKKGSKATVTLLSAVDPDEVVIPPMPPAEDWIRHPSMQMNTRGHNDTAVLKAGGVPTEPDTFDSDEMIPEWAPAVVRWWNDIWTSPMSSEFVKSDIHGLYFGCYFFHESLNPFYKIGDRNAAYKSFENIVKSYGLSPSARESLRWNIAQGSAAQKRTDQIRASASAGARKETAQNVQDLYNRHA